jgi:hypothetical protein
MSDAEGKIAGYVIFTIADLRQAEQAFRTCIIGKEALAFASLRRSSKAYVETRPRLDRAPFVLGRGCVGGRKR